VALCYDLKRRSRVSSTVNFLRTKSASWERTRPLLESLTSERLNLAARQAEKFEPITDPGVRELLKMINRVSASARGTDQKKWQMLMQLKSKIVNGGLANIYITLNPGESYSPICLFYVGEKIDVQHFYPELWSAAARLQITLENPLAVIEYFHNMVKTIIDKIFKGGLFGDIMDYYGTVEYQGRGTPHTHIVVCLFSYHH
jgi:hypothetical protein